LEAKKKSVTDKMLPKKKLEELALKKDPKKDNIKPVNRSPVKRIFNYSNPLYDRLKLK